MVVKVNSMSAIPLSNIPVPDGNILLEEAATTVYIGNEQIGIGTIYIAESKFQWVCTGSGLGFALEYPRISVHAISYDTSQFPEECVFLMVEKERTDADFLNPVGDQDLDDEDADIEIRLVPGNKQMIPDIFECIRQCQSLHPDPDQSLLSDDEDEDDDEYEDAHDQHPNLPNGDGNVLNGHHQVESEDEGMDLEDNDQFEDAPN